MQFRLATSRTTLVLYLAWELGVKLANELMHTVELLDGFYLVPLSHNKTRLHRQGLRAANRVVAAASYLEGKMGHRLHNHSVRVIKTA